MCFLLPLLQKKKRKTHRIRTKMKFLLSFCYPIKNFKVSPMGEYSEPELQKAGGSGMSQTPPSKISTPPSCKKAPQKSDKGKKEAPPNCRETSVARKG